MTYKAELNIRDKAAWDDFKIQIETNREKGVFKKSARLGSCFVNVSFIDGELFLEITPNETVNFNGNINGLIVSIDENKCHVDDIMKMSRNALEVQDAMYNKKPIKKFID